MIIYTKFQITRWIIAAFTLVMCCSCNQSQFLQNCPSTSEICGIWAIDTTLTNWRALKQAVKDGIIDTQKGFLEINGDGTFSMRRMPDFSLMRSGPIVPIAEVSGLWQTGRDRNGNSTVVLDFEKLDGQPVKSKISELNFELDDNELFINVIIGDPDSNDSLVLRKKTEGN